MQVHFNEVSLKKKSTKRVQW